MTALTDEARELFRAPCIAHLATTLPDGSPHAVAIWIHVHDDRLVFITGPYTAKAHNIERDPRVSISVAHPERWTFTAHVRGRAVDRLEGDAAWAIVDEISQDYIGQPYPRGDERVVYAVEIDRLKVSNY